MSPNFWGSPGVLWAQIPLSPCFWGSPNLPHFWGSPGVPWVLVPEVLGCSHHLCQFWVPMSPGFGVQASLWLSVSLFPGLLDPCAPMASGSPCSHGFWVPVGSDGPCTPLSPCRTPTPSVSPCHSPRDPPPWNSVRRGDRMGSERWGQREEGWHWGDGGTRNGVTVTEGRGWGGRGVRDGVTSGRKADGIGVTEGQGMGLGWGQRDGVMGTEGRDWGGTEG